MTENILLDAIRHARNLFRGKTTNKTYLNIERLPENKRAMYTPQRIKEKENIHDEFLEDFLLKEHIMDRYKHALYKSDAGEVLIGNCGELTLSILGYLTTHRVYDLLNSFISSGKRNINNKMIPVYILIIAFDDPYDHTIAVITLPEQTQDLPEINKIYDKLPDNSWVCDPWANIVCPSEDYITRWKVKMLRWHLVEKSTSVHQDDQMRDSSSPLRHANYLAITRSKKRVIHMATISPDGKVDITQG